jgi:hypothetical protein
MNRRALLLTSVTTLACSISPIGSSEGAEPWPSDSVYIGLKHFYANAYAFGDLYPGSAKVRGITVQYGTIFEALWLHWDNGQNGLRDGGYGGHLKAEIDFGPDEYLTGAVISQGYHQNKPPTVVKSIYFITTLLSGQKVNSFNWLQSSASSNRAGVAKIADWIGIFSNTVAERTCSNV